jgi:hypothetical protein
LTLPPLPTPTLVQRLDLVVTALRWHGARFRARKTDTTPVSSLRAQDPTAVFYIVGPGGTLNDLGPEERSMISTGMSASVNMAVLAPLDFRICGLEAVLENRDCAAIAEAIRAKTHPPLLWFQDRAKYDNEHVRMLEHDFGLYRYRRVSVSVRRNLATFRYLLRAFMLPRMLNRPDLAVSFALCGSVARLVLFALSLGYRRISFAGVDLGSTQYFWLEGKQADEIHAVELSQDYKEMSRGALRQGGNEAVPNLFEFLRALSEEIPEVSFATIDPCERSRLTAFLKDMARPLY